MMMCGMVNEMGIYAYSCKHEDCEIIADGIRQCKLCNRVIITDRGVEE